MSKPLTIKSFLINSKLNQQLFKIPQEVIDRDVRTFIGKPIVLKSDYKHPIIDNEFLVKKGIINPIHGFERKLTPQDIVGLALEYQKPYEVGKILDVVKNAETGHYDLVADIFNPEIRELYRKGKLPPFFSPSLIDLEPENKTSPTDENTYRFEGTHVAIVANPAYGKFEANLKAMCNGESGKCVPLLLNASAPDDNNLDFIYTIIKTGSSHVFSDSKITVNSMSKSSTVTKKTESNNKLSAIFSKNKDNKINNDVENVTKSAAFGQPPAGQQSQGPSGNPNQQQQQQGGPQNVNDVINACVNYMTEGGMQPEAALQYCQTGMQLIVKGLQGQQQGGNNMQQQGQQNQGQKFASAPEEPNTNTNSENKQLEVGENNKPETVNVEPVQQQKEETKKADIATEPEPLVEKKTKEIKDGEKDPDGEEIDEEDLDVRDEEGETLKKKNLEDLNSLKKELEKISKLYQSEKDNVKVLKKEIATRDGKIEELTAELKETKILVKSKELEGLLAVKYNDEKVRIEKAKYYASKDYDVEDLKELLGLNNKPEEQKKEESQQQKKIFVRTASASSENENVEEEKPCGCGGSKTADKQEDFYGYSRVKLLSASAPDNIPTTIETKPKTISRKMNETLFSSLLSE